MRRIIFIALSAGLISPLSSADFNWVGVSGADSMANIESSIQTGEDNHLFPGISLQVGRSFSLAKSYGVSLGLDVSAMAGKTGAVATGQSKLKYHYAARLYPWYMLTPKVNTWLALGYGGAKVNFRHSTAAPDLSLTGLQYGLGASYALSDNSVVVLNYNYVDFGKKTIPHSSGNYTYNMKLSNMSLGYARMF